MNTIFKSIALVLLAISIFSCSKKGAIEIKNKNFSEEVNLQQNLVIEFSEDVVGDSVVDAWTEDQLITFTPAVKGMFKWTAANELTFSPTSAFAASTDYKAEISEEILKQNPDKKLSLGDEIKFEFHTPYLNLVQIDNFWAKKESNKAVNEVRMSLTFNYKINPSQLKELLSIQIDNKPVTIDYYTSAVSNVVEIGISESTTSFDDKKAIISIKAGLKCGESAFVTKDAVTIESFISSKGTFIITGAIAEYSDKSGYISVSTNQEIATEDIESLIKIDPSLDFSIEKQGAGFFIKGEFTTGQAYELSIDKKLQGIFGGTLKDTYSETLLFGTPKPAISFISKKGVYLSSKGNKNIAVRIINVPKVTVKIYKVYANNIYSFFRSNNNNYGYYDDEEYYYDDYGTSYYGLEEISDVVYEKEIETKNLKKVNGTSLLNVDFSDINQFKGIYVVKVNSTEDQWLGDAKYVSISDIGLIAKEGKNDMLIMANSIINNEPLADIEINLISSNNQTVFTGKTDGSGVIHIKDLKSKIKTFSIGMVTATSGNDFNYLNLRDSYVGNTDYETGGAKENEAGYEAFIYGDREIYRPGETVHINSIVRDVKWNALKAVPVKMKVVLPNGKDFQNIRGTLNEQGAFETSFKLPESTVTGTYSVELYTSTNVLLNSIRISVEEFIPDRIKVTATVNKPELVLSENLVTNLQAMNLFGPPASNRNYEVELSLTRKYFSAEKYSNYDFGINASSYNEFESEVREGKTDAEGKGTQSFSFPSAYKNSGVLEGKIYTTVFDESGRPVHQLNRVDVYTQETFYGIQYTDSYVGTNQPFSIPMIAVNRKGVAIAAEARVEVIKYEWQTVMQKTYGDDYRYVSQKKVRVMENKTIRLSATGQSFVFTPIQSGEYEVRLYAPNAQSYVSNYFYAYGWGNTSSTSFEVNTEGKVTIETDKKEYNTGDEAKLLFKTPFEGKLIVTIERNEIFEYKVLETNNRSASMTVSLSDAYLPNVYVTATLIKPNTDQKVPLTVAHGFQNVTVNKSENKLPIEITAVASSRSRTKQKICIKTKAESNIEVTIAVVDEGILQLKNTQTPDPYNYFYRKRALEVNSYDVYARLLSELSTSTSKVGGDGYNLSKRANPLTNKRVKLVTFWSGILKTNSSGEACYEIDIPQFSGDLRIMAVAYKDNHFGSAQKNMKVADPIVISTALPRFLSPGDVLTMPITMSNTTNKPMSASVTIGMTGNVKIDGASSQQVTIPANSEKQVSFSVIADQKIGLAQITTLVKANNEEFKEVTDITVRPITSLIKVSGSGSVNGGNTASFKIENDFVPSSTSSKIVVSKSPMVGFTKNLSYLIGYPYGCIEQTTSRSFPQLYIRDLMKELKQANYTNVSPEKMVQEGINRIYTMQTYNGGFSYWPGHYESDWWGTTYATHFLIEAKKAGYDVQGTVIDKALSYLKSKVKEKGQYTYWYYNAGGGETSRVIAAKEIFYSLYVMSLYNQQDLSVMNFYKTNTSMLALDSKYLLAATYLRIGDQASYRTLLPSTFNGEKSVNSFGGSYYSYIRDMAIILDVMVENDPNNAQVGMLAKHLSEQVKNQYYLNTQETAFALIALGKIARKNADATVTADIKSNNASIGTYSTGVFASTKNQSNNTISIVAKGTGTLYYSWEAEGLSESGIVKEEDKYIVARRQYFDRNGAAINSSSFKQNDLVIVRLAVQAIDNSRIENVVLTDMLPAGFEIENPRLNDLTEASWIKNNSTPEYFDIRDDRINMFVTATNSTRYYYYMVRAVSVGTFKVGPVSADAMYNGEYHSYNGAGTITISEK
ncbi:Ig-like domain-containing alpha-2-macroglobulin family protein [uncultured Cytophaga sp.]|uniref:Ig-like domain-containing alpha-2-macroglobulin family protein n=1 Tax=uncultured Cytophaga sp. TaxID=160238 RepID=UPI0026100B2E|nr:Ig-like domain-containing alpha-2-macroglobulin family protein [uncultured Cytophaga sp.]